MYTPNLEVIEEEKEKDSFADRCMKQPLAINPVNALQDPINNSNIAQIFAKPSQGLSQSE